MPALRERSANSDTNQKYLDQIALSVFADMGIITMDQYNAVRGDVRKQIRLLQSIKDLQGQQAQEFSERFIDRILSVNENWFELVPPSTLGKAYKEIKERLNDNNLEDEKRQKLQQKFDKIANRIDDLTSNFAEKIGYYFVDTTNIADVYAGYNEMFDVREPDLEQDSHLIECIRSNRSALRQYINQYDNVMGITSVNESEESVETIEKNYDAAIKVADKYQPSESVLQTASKYKFLDKNGKPIPQFRDQNGNLVLVYRPGQGYVLDENGRLAAVVDLSRHDYALYHVADETVENKSKQDVQHEIDNGVLYKLFEIDTAEQIARGAMEDPRRFTDPAQFNQFINNLNANGGEISDVGYQSAMDAQVNKTAGWAGRIKQKLGKFASKATGFFGKIFKPIQKIDKRRDDRIAGQSPKDKRSARIEFFIRMLKGFGCAFLVSAALTAIATAAAATSLISLPVAIAAVGVMTGIGMSALAIHKWRKARREQGLDDGIKSLLQDKRMLATLGTTAIAAIAMIFGAAGMAAAAVPLGYGALALGTGNNAVSTYKDAKSAGMSTAESLAWALANAAAVVAGGFAGRAAANALIDSYNNAHQKYVKIGEHEESETVYKPETLDNAERICKMWYRDNPELLQQRVDMVNAYNAEHGTHIDPYRAIMVNADAGGMTADNMGLHVDGGGVVHSHGQHTVMTPRWAAEHGYSIDEINAIKHMFDGNQISDAGMNAAIKVEPNVSIHNEIGVVTGRPEHHDGVLPQNAVDANGVPVYTTYTGGDSPYTTVTNVVEDFGWVPGDIEPVGVVGTFGIYMPKWLSNLKDRAGSLADKIRKRIRQEDIPHQEDVPHQGDITPPPFVPNKGDKDKHEDFKPVPVIPPHEEQKGNNDGGTRDLPPAKERLALPPVREEQKIRGLLPAGHQYMRITLDQAIDLNDLPADEVQKLRKELGIKSDEEMWEAQYWAFRKADLVEAKIALKRQLENNADNEVIAKLKSKIAEYESEIPDDSYFYDHKYLTVTGPQMHALDAEIDFNYPRSEGKIANPNIKGKERDEAHRKNKTSKQKVNQVLNALGLPSWAMLHEGMYWAYRKELEYLSTNPDVNMTKKEKERKIEHLKKKIAALNFAMIGSRSEIPDDSLFYVPEPITFKDKAKGFKQGTKNVKELKEQERQQAKELKIKPNLEDSR